MQNIEGHYCLLYLKVESNGSLNRNQTQQPDLASKTSLSFTSARVGIDFNFSTSRLRRYNQKSPWGKKAENVIGKFGKCNFICDSLKPRDFNIFQPKSRPEESLPWRTGPDLHFLGPSDTVGVAVFHHLGLVLGKATLSRTRSTSATSILQGSPMQEMYAQIRSNYTVHMRHICANILKSTYITSAFLLKPVWQSQVPRFRLNVWTSNSTPSNISS